MTIEYPEYYTHFHCIADKCPDTCCAGWEVDLDDEAWYRYLVVQGAFGDKLRQKMKDDGEWKYFTLTEDGNCPFLLPDHLCEIYEKLGETALCTTCREHPRYFVDCGDYEQRDLSLGCPEVARIFFTEEGKITYIRENTEGEAEEAGVDGAGENPGGFAYSGSVIGDKGEEDLSGMNEAAGGDDLSGMNEAAERKDLSGMSEAAGRDELARMDGFKADEIDTKRRDQILQDRDRVLCILQGEYPGERVEPAQEEQSKEQCFSRGDAYAENEMTGETLPARMRVAGVWLPEEDDKLLRLAEEMEPLNNEWKEAVHQMKAAAAREPERIELTGGTEPAGGAKITGEYFHIPQKWLTRLACYFVFRYWIDAYYAEDVESDNMNTDDAAPAQADVADLNGIGKSMGHASTEGKDEKADGSEAGNADKRERSALSACLLPQIRLLNRSLRLVDMLYAAQEKSRQPLRRMIKAAYLFSRAVEFDEDNVNKLKASNNGRQT